MPLIPHEEIRFAEMSRLDPLGRVFRWAGGLYRGIHAEAEERVRAFFSSGCADALIKAGLFPKSRITEHKLEGSALVVEHEAIPLVVYPYEWSFDMLRDAALASLEAVEIAARHGWEVIDLHPNNVLFHNGRPMYIDLGSFLPLTPGRDARRANDQHKFISTFWRPLVVWKSGDSYLAHSILFNREPYMPDVSWWLYRHSGLRALSSRFSLRWSRRVERWQRNAARLLSRLNALSWLPSFLASRLPAGLLVRNPKLLRRKIARLPEPPPSQWDDYHEEVFRDGKPMVSPRCERILGILRSMEAKSVTELAGNQGAFTLMMAEHTQLQKLVCTDSSSSAINRFYKRIKSGQKPKDKYFQGAVLNFMTPESYEGISAPPERLRSDVVVALGVLHHLILTQRWHPRDIMRMLSRYTHRYVVVEFMPLGLWTAQKSKPFPDWYTVDWFRSHFSDFFDLMIEENVAPNRLLFVGRLKPVKPAPLKLQQNTAFAEEDVADATLAEVLESARI